MLSTALRAVVLGLVLAGTALPSSVQAEDKQRSRPPARNGCLRSDLKKDRQDRSLRVSLTNRCGVSLQCTVRWKVSCEHLVGNEAGAQDRSALLSADDTESFILSAQACGEGEWEITDVGWQCRPEG